MSEQGTQILSPVGRIVWGHPGKPQHKKHQDAGPLKGQTVMKDGQPVLQWAFGLAIPVADFEAHVWPAMHAEALTGYPSGVPGRFSWKIKQETDIDRAGKPYGQREGYAGHVVLTISTELQAPPVFKLENGAYRQLEPHEIKCGDYVAVGLNFKVNVATGQNTPSIYVNPQAIELVGYGAEIVGQGAPDPNALFGGAQRALPPGATAIPQQASGAPGMPGMAPAPGGMPGMPGMAPMPPAPVAGPQRPVDPSHITPDGRGGELWWNGAAWVPGAAAPAAPTLPPPAPDFVQQAVGAVPMPGAAPMPGMMPGR